MYDHTANPPPRWQPWRMDELGAAPGPHANDRPAAAPQEAGEQAEARAHNDTAREKAHREGHEKGRAEGREEGYQQGLAEGRRAGEQELATLRVELEQSWRALIGGLKTALDETDVAIGDTLTDVTLAAARRLAGDALDAKPEQVVRLVRDLLHADPLFSGQARLWLNPGDLALISPELAEELEAAGWRAQPDDTMERGGCRITGPEGELNATREARWQALLARARRFGSAPLRDDAAGAAAEDAS